MFPETGEIPLGVLVLKSGTANGNRPNKYRPAFTCWFLSRGIIKLEKYMKVNANGVIFKDSHKFQKEGVFSIMSLKLKTRVLFCHCRRGY